MDLLKLPGNATAPSPTTSSDLPTIDLQVWTTDLAVVSSVVSSLGSFAILYFFLKYSDMRTTSREILAYISLSDIIGNAMVIWGVLWTSAHHSNVSSDNIQCQVQATLLICVGIAEYLWTCALAFYLFVIIVRESAWGNARCPNVVHAVCWGCGFVVAAFAYGFGKTGVDVQARNTAQWCILRDAKDPKIGGDQAYIMWSFLVGDGWSFLAIICTITFYVIIKYHIYKEVSCTPTLHYTTPTHTTPTHTTPTHTTPTHTTPTHPHYTHTTPTHTTPTHTTPTHYTHPHYTHPHYTHTHTTPTHTAHDTWSWSSPTAEPVGMHDLTSLNAAMYYLASPHLHLISSAVTMVT